MNLKVLCTAAAVLTLASASWAQPQSGSSIGSGPSLPPPPSTGTSADSAGAAGTTAPRSPDTSVGASGATAGAASAGSTTSTGRCDTLIGEERQKCLKEQASTGTVGPGSTGMGSGAGGGTK
jgi:hypothetical protein